jgi:hypothetical protein
MKNKASILFSLVDPFEYKPEKLNAFEELGTAPMGEYHVAAFFRNVVASILNIDYKNPIRSTKNSTVYNITNTNGSVYGLLFVLNKDKFRIDGNHMVIEGDGKIVGDFSLYPFTSDKLSLSMYRDSSDALLVNIGVTNSEFVVLDE